MLIVPLPRDFTAWPKGLLDRMLDLLEVKEDPMEANVPMLTPWVMPNAPEQFQIVGLLDNLIPIVPILAFVVLTDAPTPVLEVTVSAFFFKDIFTSEEDFKYESQLSHLRAFRRRLCGLGFGRWQKWTATTQNCQQKQTKIDSKWQKVNQKWLRRNCQTVARDQRKMHNRMKKF